MISSPAHIMRYYRLHASIYDATRWSFLFGRSSLLEILPSLPDRPAIVEIGCGTGNNLPALARLFPSARITGMDLSSDMLRKAEAKCRNIPNTRLLQGVYGSETFRDSSWDLILLSYSLSITTNNGGEIIKSIRKDLKSSGIVAVVDFHTTPFTWFRRWMRFNNASLRGNLLPMLSKSFHPLHSTTHPAFGGLWSYFQYIGEA